MTTHKAMKRQAGDNYLGDETRPEHNVFTIYVDGSKDNCSPNAGVGIVVMRRGEFFGCHYFSISDLDIKKTDIELEAVIEGIRRVRKLNKSSTIITDSQHVVRWVNDVVSPTKQHPKHKQVRNARRILEKYQPFAIVRYIGPDQIDAHQYAHYLANLARRGATKDGAPRMSWERFKHMRSVQRSVKQIHDPNHS